MPAYIIESPSKKNAAGRGRAPQNNGRKPSPRELRVLGDEEDYQAILGRLTRGNGRPFVWAFPGR